MPLATKPLDFITNSTGPSLETVDQILPDTLAVHPLAHNVPSVCESTGFNLSVVVIYRV